MHVCVFLEACVDFGLVNPAALKIKCSGIHFHCASSCLSKQGVLVTLNVQNQIWTIIVDSLQLL
jgi:hypothetical protein